MADAATAPWPGILHHTRGFPAVILRPFLVYGPVQAPPKLIPAAMKAALANQDFDMTTGRQHRELTDVGDVVNRIMRARVAPAAIGQTLSLGTRTEHGVIDLGRKIYALIGSTCRPRPSAKSYRVFQGLDWRAKPPFPNGLQETLNCMRTPENTPVPL